MGGQDGRGADGFPFIFFSVAPYGQEESICLLGIQCKGFPKRKNRSWKGAQEVTCVYYGCEDSDQDEVVRSLPAGRLGLNEKT